MKYYIDFDGVILNTNDLVVKEVIKEIHDDGLNEIFEEMDWKKIYEKAPKIKNSVEILKTVQNKLDITILTKIKHLNEGIAKIEYLHNNNLNIPIILVPINISKALIVFPSKNYILVDDDAKNIAEWQKAGGTSVKFNKNSSLKFLEELTNQ